MNNKLRVLLIGIVFLIISVGLFACSNNKEEALNNDYEEADLNNGNEEGSSINNNHSEIEDNNEDVHEDEQDESNIEVDPEPLNINIIDDASLTVLVNKQNSLSEDYAPEDLVTINVPTILENPEVNQLRKEAADALYAMFEEAKTEDVYLHARSGYRSYNTQVHLFNNYVKNYGEEAAMKFSARPGHSEHQTGLVMDVSSQSVDYKLTREFGETKEGIWLKENAHKFGFIIRYPEGKEEITGYIYEPWHIRYLGVDVATAVYESGLTYEEFLVEEGIIHAVNAIAGE